MSASREQNTWTCTKCTLKNSNNNDVCDACHDPKPGDSASWNCTKCSLINPERNTRCSACGSARTHPIELAASQLFNGVSSLWKRVVGEQNPQWNCPKCTLENTGSTTSCEACGSPKEVIVVPDDEQLDSVGQSSRKIVPNKDIKRLSPNLRIDIPIVLDKEAAEQSPELVVKCPKCQTLLVDNADVVCAVCGARCQDEGFKPRPFPSSSVALTPESSPPSIPGKWNCPSCTYMNENFKDKCEMCNTENASATGVETTDHIVPRGVCPSSINEPSTSGLGATSSSGRYIFAPSTKLPFQTSNFS